MSESSPQTVFIVGAGASKDFGAIMPLGSELANRIEQSLNNELDSGSRYPKGPIFDALTRLDGGMTDAHVKAGERIRRAIHSQDSIDDLLDAWRDTPAMLEVGKTAIAQIILSSEHDSHLGRGEATEQALVKCIGPLRETWLGKVVRFIRPGMNRKLLADALEDVGFIVFNYDRCVERMLEGELLCNTVMSRSEAQAYVRQMPIVHPYGSLTGYGDPGVYPFGRLHEYVGHMATGIRTYTEEEHNEKELAKIRALLESAKQTIFLGFSYHPKNMSLLTSNGLKPSEDIYGACQNPITSRLDAAKSLLFPETLRSFSDRLTDLSCTQFISAFRGKLFGAEP